MKGNAGPALALMAVFSLGLLIFGGGPAAADGIGVYPSSIVFEDSLRGGEYFQTLGVINDSGSERTFGFQTDGEVSPWLSFVDPADRTKAVESIVAPAGSEARVFVRLLVPNDVPNRLHTGLVRVFTAISEGEPGGGAGAAVNIGAEVAIEVNVTGTQRLAGSLLDVATRNVEVGYPLRIRSTIRNSGNVRVNPQIHLEVVDLEGNLVAQASFPEDPSVPGELVFPNETKIMVSEWDTTGQELGERIARVSARFGGFDFGTKEVGFNILAVGTLTRRGEMEELKLANLPNPGELAKIIATFRNTGEIDTRGKFVGELYRGDRLVEAVSGEERLAQVGETVDLEAFANIPETGEYTVRGKVNYEGKETKVQELTFRVGLGGGGLPIWVWIGIGGGAIVGAAAVLAGRSALMRRSAARPS